jgi:hypothetical protein
MMHSDITLAIARERRKRMLAAADRHRLARQVRDAERAARRGRATGRDSRLRPLQRLSKILLRGM